MSEHLTNEFVLIAGCFVIKSPRFLARRETGTHIIVLTSRRPSFPFLMHTKEDQVRSRSVILLSMGLLLVICTPAFAGVKIVNDNPVTLSRLTSEAAVSEARERVFTAQVMSLRDRIHIEGIRASLRSTPESSPKGRDGSISGDVSISPAPPEGVYYEGMILAVDRYGFVVNDDYWDTYYSDYTLYDLPPGEYYVFFLSDGWTNDVHEGSVINEFYDGAIDWTQATLVEVVDSEETTGIDFSLQSNSGHAAVVMRDSEGQPLAYTNFYIDLYKSIPEDLPGDVELEGTERVLEFSVYTDENGRAIVGAIPLGVFYMSCSGEGFEKVYYPGTTDPDEAETLEIETVGQVLVDITFDLMPGGSIAGEVLLDNGDPALGATINVYEVGDDTPTTSITVDDLFDGEYQVDGLSQGTYVVQVEPSFLNLGYGAEYWDDKPDAASADPILVQEGEITEDIDFVLEPAPGGAISGLIQSSFPEAYDETMFILLLYPADDSTDVVGLSMMDTLDAYTIGGLDAGDYKLALYGFPYPLEPFYYDDSWSFAEATVVTVTADGTTQNIDFDLPALGIINGTITVTGDETEIDEIASMVLALPEELPTDLDLSTLAGSFGIVEEDGSYRLIGMQSGGFKVWVATDMLAYDVDEQSYCPEFYGGAFNFNDAEVVNVTAGQATDNIDIELDPEAVVQGFVSLPGGSPAGDEDVEVHIAAYDTESGFPVGLSISDESQVYSEGDNTFCAGYRIRGLPAVSVKLAAIPYGPQAGIGYYGGGHTFDQGSDIQLTAGETFPSDVNISLSQSSGTISGHVERVDNGEPMNDVVIAAYDLTGHVTGYGRSGENPATGDQWEDGRYEIAGLVGGTTHYVRTWNALALFEIIMDRIPTDLDDLEEDLDLDFDSFELPEDEWYYEVTAELLPWETGFYIPLASYLFWGFMPSVEVPLEATQVPVQTSGVDFTLYLGSLDATLPIPPERAELVLNSIRPNPASTSLGLAFSLSEAQEVSVDVYDLVGRRVNHVPLGLLDRGFHRVRFADTMVAGLPSGVYSLRLVGRETVASRQLVVLP